MKDYNQLENIFERFSLEIVLRILLLEKFDMYLFKLYSAKYHILVKGFILNASGMYGKGAVCGDYELYPHEDHLRRIPSHIFKI